MKKTLAVLSAAALLAGVGQAEARRGGSFFSKAVAAPVKAQPGRVEAGRSSGGLIIVPIPRAGRSQSAVEDMPPPEHAEQAGPDILDIPTASVTPAPEVPVIAAAAEKGPWCSDGYVVGGGAGVCVVTLKPELRGAPAILAVSN